MKWFILPIIIGLFTFCESNSKIEVAQKEVSTVSNSLIEKVTTKKNKVNLISPKLNSITYDSLLLQIQKDKAELLQAYNNQNIDLDSLSDYFTTMMVDHVFPYWSGTPWDFNGHTDIPNQDYVACGYFVSTPLRHVGLRFNRFKLAQQASLNIVKSLAIDTKVTSYKSPVILDMIKEIKTTYNDGLYVVGLSNHVGFLYLNDNELYFIHSNYMEPMGVVAEVAAESMPFIYSNVFYLASISNNKTLLEKWLKGGALTIVGV